MSLTLLEELLLLAYHDETGRNRAVFLHYGLAGAALMELAIAERIGVRDKRCVVIDSRPTGDLIVDETLATIAESKPTRPQVWVTKLTKFQQRVIESLEDKGIVRHQQDRLLGLVPFNRYLPTDGRAEAGVIAQLDRLVESGTTADSRTIAMGSLVCSMRLEHLVFPERKAAEVRRILTRVTAGDHVDTTLQTMIQATSAAVSAGMSAVMAGTAG